MAIDCKIAIETRISNRCVIEGTIPCQREKVVAAAIVVRLPAVMSLRHRANVARIPRCGKPPVRAAALAARHVAPSRASLSVAAIPTQPRGRSKWPRPQSDPPSKPHSGLQRGPLFYLLRGRHAGHGNHQIAELLIFVPFGLGQATGVIPLAADRSCRPSAPNRAADAFHPRERACLSSHMGRFYEATRRPRRPSGSSGRPSAIVRSAQQRRP